MGTVPYPDSRYNQSDMRKNILLAYAVSAALSVLQALSADCFARQDKAFAAVIEQWQQENAARWEANMASLTVSDGALTMKFSYTVFGDKPDDGRSLYISMHGGGNTAASVNDSQWENQKRLYKPDEGVYVCPRAPWNDWDMWFKPPMDRLLEELIQTLAYTLDVNPDKVYLMGYSAGGDGVWRLAPRLADHFAAASMMAGHPGDVGLVNVRNLPFTIWVGGDDAAYNRNREVALRGRELDSLSRSDPEGYIHETHVLEGYPHWMDLKDAAAVPWMAQFRRHPYPEKIVWRQEEVLRDAFYWIEVPHAQARRGMTVIASRNGNVIDIARCDYPELTIYLNHKMVDMSKKVTVRYQGRELFRGKLKPSAETARQTLESREDPAYMFESRIRLEVE